MNTQATSIIVLTGMLADSDAPTDSREEPAEQVYALALADSAEPAGEDAPSDSTELAPNPCADVASQAKPYETTAPLEFPEATTVANAEQTDTATASSSANPSTPFDGAFGRRELQ